MNYLIKLFLIQYVIAVSTFALTFTQDWDLQATYPSPIDSHISLGINDTDAIAASQDDFGYSANLPELTKSPVNFTNRLEAAQISDLIIVSGNSQSGFLRERLPESLVVKVVNDQGEGVPDVRVLYNVTSAPPNASSFSVFFNARTTDEDGEAGNLFTLGDTSGEYTIEAQIEDNPEISVTFTVSASILTMDDYDWDVINPTIQPNDLEIVHLFDDGTAIAAGEFGTVMKSTDNGISWSTTHLITGDNISFFEVAFIGDTGWLVGENGTILKTMDKGDTWFPLNSATDNDLEAVFFLDNNNGWIGGESGTVLKTTDGGSSWTDQSVSSTLDVSSIQFLSPDNGFVGLKNSFYSSTTSDQLFITTDGGVNWTLSTFSSDGDIYDIHFENETNGWLSTYGGIFYTDNAGETWTEQINVNNTLFYKLYFKDSNNGLAVSNGNSIYRTTDGENWIQEQIDPPFGLITDIAINSGNNIVAIGSRGIIMTSTDNGDNWIASNSSSISFTPEDVDFTSNNIGYLVNGTRFVYKTDDAGNTWEEIDTGVSSGLGGTLGISRIYFSDHNNGWAVTRIGDVLNTTDAGESWTIDTEAISTESNRTLNAVFAIDQNTVFIGGGNGQTYHLKRTTDGGETWTDLISSNGVNDVVRDLFFTDANNGWAITEYVVYKTTDGGDSWTESFEFALSNDFTKVTFTDPNTGFLLNDRTLFKTTDAGNAWIELSGSANSRVNDVHFSDNNTGWLVNSSFFNRGIYFTQDGGETWQRNRMQTASTILKIFALNETNVWAFGQDGIVLRSKSSVFTSSEEQFSSDTPNQFNLEQNYPNPFNPTTNIRFNMPEAGIVKLSVFNVLGQRVSTLIAGERFNSGQHNVTFDASHLSSGMYLYRIEISAINNATFTKTGRMVLIK